MLIAMIDRLATDADLEELTGYQMPGKQLECLRKYGLRPVVRPDGRPRVTFAALTAAMIGALPASEAAARLTTPNFTALRKAG